MSAEKVFRKYFRYLSFKDGNFEERFGKKDEHEICLLDFEDFKTGSIVYEYSLCPPGYYVCTGYNNYWATGLDSYTSIFTKENSEYPFLMGVGGWTESYYYTINNGGLKEIEIIRKYNQMVVYHLNFFYPSKIKRDDRFLKKKLLFLFLIFPICDDLIFYILSFLRIVEIKGMKEEFEYIKD